MCRAAPRSTAIISRKTSPRARPAWRPCSEILDQRGRHGDGAGIAIEADPTERAQTGDQRLRMHVLRPTVQHVQHVKDGLADLALGRGALQATPERLAGAAAWR